MNRVRLIILDDDPIIGRAIQDVAEMAGAQARFTIETSAFFNAVDEFHPTHVAIDLVMPDMDGIEVLTKLAGLKIKAKVIITSGLDSRVLDAACRFANERGLTIAGVLSKPFSPSTLRALLIDTTAADQYGNTGSYFVAESIGAQGNFEVTEQELRRAYADRELHLVYQPQISCATGQLAGFEALVRWIHPQQGVIMPNQFIPYAESHNLIDELTQQVLDQAIAWIATSYPGSNLTMAVNISARRAISRESASASPFAEISLVQRIKSACHEHGLDPSKLILELTETSAMEDPVGSLDILTRVRMHGVQLSIDDFGTGYSSMIQLVRMPFSEIKVDRSFVATACHSRESRAIVKSIVDLGHSLKLRVVAEGVEDVETLQYLRKIECDLAQGYLIGRPMSGDAVQGWTTLEASRFAPNPGEYSLP